MSGGGMCACAMLDKGWHHQQQVQQRQSCAAGLLVSSDLCLLASSPTNVSCA
jgi:hypothetical protein